MSKRGNASKGLDEPGLVPQSSSTLLSLGMEIVTHGSDNFGSKGWTSQNMRTPPGLLDYFLQDQSILSDDKPRLLCLNYYFSKAGIKVYLRDFSLSCYNVARLSFCFILWKPYRWIRANHNSLPYHVNYFSYEIALFNQDLRAFRVNSKRRPFILYSSYLSLFRNMSKNILAYLYLIFFRNPSHNSSFLNLQKVSSSLFRLAPCSLSHR